MAINAMVSDKSPMNQPSRGYPKNTMKRGRWHGSAHRRFGDGPSAYPRDKQGNAEILLALLYNGTISHSLEKKQGNWFHKGSMTTYHQGALVDSPQNGMGLNEKQRLQRKKDLMKIRDDLSGLRAG